MDITGLSGGGASQAVDPKEVFSQWAAKKIHTRGDSVSISEEGRAKAEEAAKAKMSAKAGAFGAPDAEDERTDGLAVLSGDEAEGSSPAKSTEEQATDLEERIKGLMDQLMGIMQSALPPQEKMQQAQPIQQEIAQLQMQLNELKAQMKKAQAA